MTQFIPHALNVSEFKRKISAIFGAFSAVFFVMCCVLYYLALIFRPLFLLVMLCTVCSTIAGIAVRSNFQFFKVLNFLGYEGQNERTDLVLYARVHGSIWLRVAGWCCAVLRGFGGG